MQPSTLITLLTAATMATAVPATGKHGNKPHKSAGTSSNTCGQDQKLSCCNSVVGVGVLGSECELLSTLGGNCNGNVQCCDVKQNGDINLVNLCVPVSL